MRDGDQWTPLHAASSGGAAEVVTFLLSVGADVKAVNEENETPYDVAEEEEVQKILLSKCSGNDFKPGTRPSIPFSSTLEHMGTDAQSLPPKEPGRDVNVTLLLSLALPQPCPYFYFLSSSFASLFFCRRSPLCRMKFE